MSEANWTKETLAELRKHGWGTVPMMWVPETMLGFSDTKVTYGPFRREYRALGNTDLVLIRRGVKNV